MKLGNNIYQIIILIFIFSNYLNANDKITTTPLINIEEKKYDEALAYIEKVNLKDAFKQVLSEIKGDIYKFKGDKENALKYYTEAIDSSAINNENLLMKKNSVKN